MRLYPLVLLAVLLISSVNSYAEQGLERLVELFGFSQYQANFEQHSFDANGKALQQLQGRIVLQKPDQFYWQSGEPFPQQIISDGKTIWHYDEDLEQVVIQQYDEQLQHTPLLLILNHSDNIKANFELKKYHKKRQQERFTLSLKDSDNSIKTIELEFLKAQLVGLSFTDNMQQSTAISFSDIELNQAAEASLFEFEVPEGADVLHE